MNLYKKYNISFLLIFFFTTIVSAVSGDLDTSFNTTGIVVTNIARTFTTVDTARAVVEDIQNRYIVIGSNGIDFAAVRYTSMGLVDTTFGDAGIVTTNMGGSEDMAYAVTLDSQQNIIIVGSNGTDFAIARYTSDGLLDTTFNGDGIVITHIGSSTESVAYGVAVDSNDNIIAVGTDDDNFIVARYLGTGDTAGSLDTTFGTEGIVTSSLSGSAAAYAVTIQSDGKIVVVGTSKKYFAVARYISDGSLDTSFNGSDGYTLTKISKSDIAYAVAIQSDGKIVLAGNSKNNFALARYTDAGILDTVNFAANKGYVSTSISGTAIGYSLDITSDGKIVVGGVSKDNFTVAQYTSTGDLDKESFGFGDGYVTTEFDNDSTGYGLIVHDDNKILLVGTTEEGFSLVQYTSTGDIDTSGFGESTGIVTTTVGIGSIDTGRACAVQTDGKIIVAGQSGDDFSIVRYMVNGSLDTNFGDNGIVVTDIASASVDSAYGIAIQQDGKIIVVGTSSSDFSIARYTTSGNLDTTFGTDGKTITDLSGTTIAYDVKIQPDGKIIVVGVSNNSIIVARYTSDGYLDTSFADGNGYVITSLTGTTIAYALDFTSDGKIVVAGISNNKLMIAQYTNDGFIDTSNFGSGLGYVLTEIDENNFRKKDKDDDDDDDDDGKKKDIETTGYSVVINKYGKILVSGVIKDSSNSYLILAQYTSAGILDTEKFGSSLGYITAMSDSSDIACAHTIQSDTNIIVGEVGGKNCILSRYTTEGLLDTTFGIDGKVTTELTSDFTSNFLGLNLQQNGTIVVSTSASSGSGDFFTARFLGDVPQGCIDSLYQSNGYLIYPENSVEDNAQAVALQIQSDNSVFVASRDFGLAEQSKLIKLNADGSTNLEPITIPELGVVDIIHDLDDNLLVIGTDVLSQGWIRKYTTSTGSFVVDSTFGIEGLVSEIMYATSFKRVCQQLAGRIIVMGQGSTATTGILISYNENGGIDTTFGVNGLYTSSLASFSDMVIDDDDTIYIASQSAYNIEICNIKSDGSGLVDEYNSGNSIDTGLASELYGSPSIAFDNDAKIILVAVEIATGNFVFQRYTTIGTLDVATIIYQSDHALLNPVITQLQCDTYNRPFFVGYDDYNCIVGRLQNNITLGLDTVFSPYSTTPGILHTSYNSTYPTDSAEPKRVISAINIGPNAQLLCCGYEAVTSSTSMSFITRIVGDTVSYNQVPRYPRKKNGVLDTTFNAYGVDPGSMNLHEELECNNGKAKQIEFSESNDTYYIAVDDGINVYVISMDSGTDTKNTDFGFDGIITILGEKDVSDLFLDATGALNIVGGNGSSGSSAGWISRYNAITGDFISSFEGSSYLDTHTVIGQQSSTRILVAGQDNGIGTIIAYNSVTGAIDTTFGINGRYETGYSSSINSMVIGYDDAIYFITNNGTDATTFKLTDNGFTVVWTCDVVTSGSSINSNNYLALDIDGNPVVCTVDTETPQIVIQKYYSETGITSAVLNLTDTITNFSMPFINSFIIDSTNKLLIAGYDEIENNPFVARVLADMSGLDTAFNYDNARPGIQLSLSPFSDSMYICNDIHITDKGNILIAGSSIVSSYDQPYISRLYGDSFVVQNNIVVPIGDLGILDPTFYDNGICDLTSLSDLFINTAVYDLVSYKDGSYCLGVDNGTNSQCLHILKNMDLSLSDSARYAPRGVNSMILDGDHYIIFVGTNDIDGGWIHRHFVAVSESDHDGSKHIPFGENGVVLGQMDEVTFVVQQTLGRYVVVGKRDNNNVLRAYDSLGKLDVTFHSTGIVPGELILDHNVYSILVDQFDRLIFAYKNESSIDITRLTSNGYFDSSFNSVGVFTTNIVDVDDSSQVQSVLDSAGNIIIATHIDDGENKIAVVAYDSSGIQIYDQLNISDFIDPVLTDLVAVEDGGVFVVGHQSGNHPMWVVKINSDGTLDTTFGSGNGIIEVAVDPDVQSERVLQALAIRPDGRFMLVGYEIDLDGTIHSFLIRAYYKPYQLELERSPMSASSGTIDTTFGRSGISSIIEKNIDIHDKKIDFRDITEDGVTFFASAAPPADAASNQVAQAIAMQDVDTYVVAIDGGTTDGGESHIFINEFDVNGALITAFNGTGQVTLPHYYDDEYVRDVVTFTTIAGVNKAILAGYVTNSTLGTTNSILWQYDLTSVELDSDFGGFNGDPMGIALSSGQEAHTVGQQSTGRIITTGLDQSGNGLILGYTSLGKKDMSFGSDASSSFIQGTTGIYTHTIDTENRIIIAYNDGSNNVAVARILADGSALDATFGTGGLVTDEISGISGNSNIKITHDSSGNIIVASVNNSGVDVVIKRYTGAGAIDDTLTVTSATLGTITSFTLARLLVNTDGNVIAVGWDNITNDQLVILQTESDLTSLDSGFNDTGTPGYLKYDVGSGSTQIAKDALIHPDGRIIVVGWEN